MAAPVRLSERATVQQQSAGRDSTYGRKTETWASVAERVWVEVQETLPSRAERTEGGAKVATQQARLRLRRQIPITADSRVILHGRGDRVMQVVSGPALLDDRTHVECMLEEVRNG